jgi:hypothetical protein
MKLIRTLGALALTAMLVACGGGGGSPGLVPGQVPTNPGTTTSVVTPATIEVLASSNEVLSAGAEVLITAVVKNVNNAGMADQPVTFSSDSGVLLSQQTTNADGIATARLSAGSNKALRNINVAVRSGSAAGSITLPVTGTRLNLTGATSIKRSDATTYVARLLDSSGNGISGAAVSVASSLGNALSTRTAITSPNGEVQFLYTANSAGTDTITVSGLGATAVATVGVSAIDFIVLSPGAGTSILVNTPQTVTVQYRDIPGPISGATVQFSTTRGSLSAQAATTNGAGQASVTVISTSAGPANLVASIVGVGQVTLPLNFIATNPAALILQANPGALLPNLNGGSSNQSTIEAVVRDSVGNSVANQQVNFSIESDDGNGGSLSTPSALTDASGRAQVQFVSGPQSTRTNGVRLRATVAGTSVVGTSALTVNGQALFISFGFGNEISNRDQTTYSQLFSVYVTDANGNAVGNQQITVASVPLTYGKGFLEWSGTVYTASASSIPPLGAFTECPNEDTNRNGTLDAGEDLDGNGRLSPGNPAVVVPGRITTDSQGRGTFALEYGEQFAPWVEVELVASASVGGSESRSSLPFPLRGSSPDFTTQNTPPAGVESPFGRTQSCTSP